MKIAIFQNLPDGGAMRTVYEQVKGLSENHKLDMYCFNNINYKDMKSFLNKIYIYAFNVPDEKHGFKKRVTVDFMNFISLRKVHKRIARDIDEKRYDLVLVHSDRWTESPFILRYLKTKNVYHCHELLRIAYEDYLKIDMNLPLHKKLYEYLTRKLRKNVDLVNARSAQKIITSSKYIANQVKTFYKKSATVIHLGADTDIFKNSENNNNKYVLYIGKRNMEKGYDTYLKVKSLLKDSKKLSWIELGFDRGQKIIESDKDLAKIYSNALCLLCLSRNEPFGLTALEAMACSTPVIAVSEGGYKETILDKKTGFLLPRSPKALASKIEFLFSNLKVRDTLGDMAGKHVEQHFTWEKYIINLERYFDKLVLE
ncbi:MAG TPA: glycosyltransferase family 4 protein [Patescibacteria group bacterium]|nr:glycosyltransferase family 4 protein [Patescibacteria group bacterium]